MAELTTHYIDEDTTDAFLDLPESRYAGGRTAAEVAAEALAPDSKIKPAKLPPLTDPDVLTGLERQVSGLRAEGGA